MAKGFTAVNFGVAAGLPYKLDEDTIRSSPILSELVHEPSASNGLRAKGSLW
jgi:hypothetical protein